MRLILFAASLLLIRMPQAQTAQTATVEGIVIKLGSGEPVARAQVVLSGTNGGAAGALKTATDGDGKFFIRDIPAGRYRVFATRDGYIRAEYGQRTLGGGGKAVTLVAGQDLKDVGLSLTPTGTISGRIYNRDGDPVVNANVQLFVYKYANGLRGLGVVQAGTTNDLGEYRLYWLQPDKYILSATPRQVHDTIIAGPGAGRQGFINVVGGATIAIARTSSDEIGLPVYFPGTTDLSAAAPIDLRPGATFGGADLTIDYVRAVHVRGRLTSSATGQPPRNGTVTLTPRTVGVSVNMPQSNARITSDGEFDFEGVAPGSYDLVSITNESGTPGVSGRYTARVPIEVGNADVNNVPLILQPGFNVTGRLLIDGQPPTETPDGQRLTVGLRFDPPIAGPGAAPNSGVVDPSDGTFMITTVTPGSYQVTVGNLRNWYIQSALMDGRDVLNSGLRIESPPLGTLEIQISRNAGTFDATILDDTQEPATNVMAVLVPDPARRQRSEAYRNALTDDAGHIHFDGVTPGDYKAFAWEGAGVGAWQDPDFMRMYEDRGKPVHISDGGAASSELRLITVSP